MFEKEPVNQLKILIKEMEKHIIKNLDKKLSVIGAQKTRNAWIEKNMKVFALSAFVDDDLENIVESTLKCHQIPKDHQEHMRPFIRAVVLDEFIAAAEKANSVLETLSHNRFDKNHREECNDCRDAYNDFLQEQNLEAKED